MIKIKNLTTPTDTPIYENQCTLYPTFRENWNNFVAVPYNEISDFQAWSIKVAFNKILCSESGNNCWYWSNGMMVQEYYKGTDMQCRVYLYLTNNGILVLKVDDADYNQIAQFVVKMK